MAVARDINFRAGSLDTLCQIFRSSKPPKTKEKNRLIQAAKEQLENLKQMALETQSLKERVQMLETNKLELEQRIGAAPSELGIGGSGLLQELADLTGRIATLEGQIGIQPTDSVLGSGHLLTIHKQAARIVELEDQVLKQAPVAVMRRYTFKAI